MLIRCPKPEQLLEFVTVHAELPFFRRAILRTHLMGCRDCQAQVTRLESNWKAYFAPEPDITHSLIRVFSKLQQDETLILKGWKLSASQPRSNWMAQGWVFRGAVSLGVLVLTVSVIFLGQRNNQAKLASNTDSVPYAQYRLEEPNGIRVEYVKPELLQSVEFETTSVGR